VSAPLRGRLVRSLVRLLAWSVCRLPEAPLHRLFAVFGWLHYRFAGERRGLARGNLLRVCRWLEAGGLAAPHVAAAAHDRHALERLVREVFRHHARYYLEVLRVTVYSPGYVAGHLALDDPAMTSQALDDHRQGVVFVGMHFGAMELPARLAALRRPDPVLAPMETLADPSLHAWFYQQRASVGIEPLDPRGAGRRLVERARRGGGVAIVGDRPIGGPGRPVSFFGAPAALPVGPALTALEAGVPAWAAGARRTGWGRYAVGLEAIPVPSAGPLRERVAAFMDAEVAAFERLIAEAPEQWWTLLFPIWEDGA
jgi:KDO2-lipid IV(A) lauroyltransferase